MMMATCRGVAGISGTSRVELVKIGLPGFGDRCSGGSRDTISIR
jgi:hypothetical protein